MVVQKLASFSKEDEEEGKLTKKQKLQKIGLSKLQ